MTPTDSQIAKKLDTSAFAEAFVIKRWGKPLTDSQREYAMRRGIGKKKFYRMLEEAQA